MQAALGLPAFTFCLLEKAFKSGTLAYLPGPVKLHKLATFRGRLRYETVYRDSPDTGFVEGQLIEIAGCPRTATS